MTPARACVSDTRPPRVLCLTDCLGCLRLHLQTIRYPWYAATLLDDCPDSLTWLRYTAFIPLYPLGVVAEMILLYVSVFLTPLNVCRRHLKV